ncbi:MAG: anhydro-N-acetylmuramic acid kinase [Bryobacterales bacterium]|nr:anhydro-N-acetylmuramic acid kinase [Bryobacteraceae bacterium]MDW8353634.1 anhydro-N-acetylmuramic acid kinase [Bryobacterales bacterium]
MTVAGVMSGTSLDGVDVAIIDLRGPGRWTLRSFSSTPYPPRLRAALLAVSNAPTHTAEIARLHFLLGEVYADAVRKACRKAGLGLRQLDLIACHGQTIFHQGDPVRFLGRPIASTLQIGEPCVIAERTGVPVVADFRPRDIAAGGKGAPLVPFVDYWLFRHPRRGRVALNLGGIANLTALPPGATLQDVIAFDTGPGNMVIDALVREHTQGRMSYDRDGRLAGQGRVDRQLLSELLQDPFYRRRPPKTAGREQYGREFVARLRATGRSMTDLIATATALTAAAVAIGIDRYVRPRMPVDELILSGGGAFNPRIRAHLAAWLPGTAIALSDDYGVPAAAKEAVAFAILGYETWRRRPSNVPSATGAHRAVVLGKIVP